MEFSLNGSTGWDSFFLWFFRVLFSEERAAKYVAQRALHTIWKGADPEATRLYLNLWFGSFRIIDTDGNVVRESAKELAGGTP